MKIIDIKSGDISLLLSIVKTHIKNNKQLEAIKKQLRQELDEIGDNRIISIATIENKTVAMIQLIMKKADNDPELADEKDICHVHNLQVRKDFQKQGIGRKMMDYVEAQAKQLGKKVITLGVDGDNARAIKLYKNRNYEIFKEEEGRRAGELLYLMKKEL